MFSWDSIQRRPDGKILLLYRHERVFEAGLIRRGSRVLDVGGWGVFASRVIEEGADCLLLDNFSKDQHYAERVRSLPHVVGDILDKTLLETLGVFDVVTCFEMLEHCLDQETAVMNKYACLKPGGFFVGTVPLPGVVHAADEPGIKFLDENTLFDLLDRVGFVSILLERTGSVSVVETPCSLYFCAVKGME
jgi:SAM-dependent methyltransferase